MPEKGGEDLSDQSAVLLKVASIDNTMIACWRSGFGPPLVLVHGISSDHTRWRTVLSTLQKHFTVYSIDRRGRKESGDSLNYSIECEFEDVASVVNSINEPVNLLGHSYGAICALEGTLLAHNVKRLILYEPPIPFGKKIYPRAVINKLQNLLDDGDLDGVITTFMQDIIHVPKKDLELLTKMQSWKGRRATAHTVPRELEANLQYNFVREKFRKFNIPTLLLLGSESPFFFKNAIETLRTMLKNSRVVIMPGQQHNAMDTATQLFNKEILRFLTI